MLPSIIELSEDLFIVFDHKLLKAHKQKNATFKKYIWFRFGNKILFCLTTFLGQEIIITYY